MPSAKDGGEDVAFRTRKLERCYREHRAGVREFGAEAARRYIERINLIKSARDLDELLFLPGLHGHPLKGDRAGQFAIRLTGYLRLIFTVPEDGATTVCIEEVSKHYED